MSFLEYEESYEDFAHHSCNYCRHQSILAQAKKEGMVVTTINENMWPTVYVHPADVDVKAITVKEREPYFKASFMSLPNHCAC